MDKKLNNKVAIITGASGGFGNSIATKFAENGCELILTYKSNKKNIEILSKKLNRINCKFQIVKADISKKKDRQKILSGIKKNKIDILVNNAGINEVRDFLEIKEKDWDKIIDTNLKSTFFLTQDVFKIMKKNLNGKIINISSGAALYHGPRTAHYAISKAGIISFTKLLARFGAKYNILSNAIAPGIIKTSLTKKEVLGSGGKNYINMTLLKKYGTLTDVSNAALYLSSNEQNYITGEVINITGGAYLG
tara:strand:+ start:2037 stop:2786 length:750 start_codon:yes stop_codon:yes gene_type:complete